MYKKGKNLALCYLNGKRYGISFGSHVLERMQERGVDEYEVSGTVLALGKDEMRDCQEERKDIAVIDRIVVIARFKKRTVHIISVFNTTDVFIKDKTIIKRVQYSKNKGGRTIC